jgi:hypothetical protein
LFLSFTFKKKKKAFGELFGNFGDFMTLPFGVDIRRHFAICEFFPVKFEMFFFFSVNQKSLSL